MKYISQFQKALLEVYKAFASFCERNDISFFAAYGTMIGAIRHHGFIPWDDDIDVFMKRDEYDKFVALRNTLEGTSYKISVYLDGQSPYPFAKFLLIGFGKGVFMDLPSLAKTNNEMVHVIQRLDDLWNCELKHSVRFMNDAYIWHYQCTNKSRNQ